MKRLQNRLGLNEIDLPDERKSAAVAEPDEELEEATVGAGAPVSPLPHDPTHPAVDGSSDRVAEATPLANTPSLADTTPMPIPDADGNGDARAPTPSTDGDDPDTSTEIPFRRQQNPDAT